MTYSSTKMADLLLGCLVICATFPIRMNKNIGPFATVAILDICLLICLTYIVVRTLITGEHFSGSKHLLVLLALPVLIAVLSMGWTIDLDASIKVVVTYIYALLCYYCALYFTRFKSSKFILYLLCFMVAGWLIGSICMYLQVPGFGIFVPEGSYMTSSDIMDNMAGYMRFSHPYIGKSNDYAPLFAFTAFVFIGAWRMTRRKIYGFMSLLSFIAIIGTLSRGVMVAAIGAVLIYLFFARMRFGEYLKIILIVGFVAFAMARAASMINVELKDRTMDAERLVEDRMNMSNVDNRMQRYTDNIEMVSNKPLLGYGAGVYERFEDGQLALAHNTYLEQWKFYGVIIGSVSALCVILIVPYFGLYLKGANERKPLIIGIMCGWLCLLISATTQTFFEASVPRALIFLMLGLCSNLAIPGGKNVVRFSIVDRNTSCREEALECPR